MPIQTLIEPQQNNLLDTFLTAQKLKAYQSENALNEAKAAELPYTREREAALNAARIEKTQADTKKTSTDTWNQRLDWLGRTGDQRAAVSFLDEAIADGTKEWMPIRERIVNMSPDEARPFIQNLAVSVKDQMTQQLNERKFGEQQKQSAIDNTFQQGHLGVAQAGLGERQRHNQVMEARPQAGFSMGYDADGRPVFVYGTKSEETAAGTERGKTRAQAEQSLPGVEDLSAAMLKQVDELLTHPGFKSAVGATLLPYASRVPGTSEGDFVNRLEQVKGAAFLQAFEKLKGGGQITVIEGEKATQAINRMNTATSENEFRAAAADFKSVIAQARDRARNAAKAPRVVIPYGGESDQPAPAADAPNYKSLLDELMQ